MQRQFCSRDRRKEKRSRGRVSGTRGRRWSTFLPWILVLTPRLRNRCKLAPRIQRWHLDCIQVMLSLRGSAVPGSCRLFTEKWKTRSSRGQSLGKIPAFKVRVAHSLFSCYLLSLGYFFEKDIYTQREKTLNDINHYKVRHMFWYEGGVWGERVAAAPRFYDEVRFFRIFLVLFGIVIFWSPISAKVGVLIFKY